MLVIPLKEFWCKSGRVADILATLFVKVVKWYYFQEFAKLSQLVDQKEQKLEFQTSPADFLGKFLRGQVIDALKIVKHWSLTGQP